MSEPKTDMGADAQHQAGRSPRRWWIWIALLGVALALSLAAWLLWQGETRRAPGTVITQAPPAGMRPPAPPAADAQAGTTGAAPPPAGAPSATANPGATQPGTAGRPRHPIENALGGEGPVDPRAQVRFVAGPLGSHADRRVGRGAASWGRSDGDPRQDDQRQRWPAWQPTTTRVNRRGKRSVEGGHGDGQQALSPGRERERPIAHGLCPPLE